MALFQTDIEPRPATFRPLRDLLGVAVARLRGVARRTARSPRDAHEAMLRREAARRAVDALLR